MRGGKVGQQLRQFAVGIGGRLRSTFAWLWTNADPVSKWATTLGTIGVVGGAIFAYYQFELGGGADWAINLSLSTEVVRYDDKSALLVVHVTSKNPRSSEVDLEPPNDAFVLTVKRLPDSIPIGTVIDPDDQSDDSNVIKRIDLLPKEGYVFPPGANFDDTRGVLLPLGSKVSLSVRLNYAGDDISTSGFVTVEPPGNPASLVK